MLKEIFFYGVKIFNMRNPPIVNRKMFVVKTLYGFYHIEVGEYAEIDAQISLYVKNFGRNKISDLRIQFLGLREDYHQKILEINCNTDLNTKYDEHGNIFHEVLIPFLKPKQELRILVNYKIKVYPRVFSPPYYYPDIKIFLEDQPFQKRSDEIITLASKLKSEDAYATIKNIVGFLISNIAYERTYRRIGAINTLERKRGSCLGFSDLVVTLLRCAGIPARVIRGTYMNELHAWVEAYVKPYGWIPIDPVAGIIGAIGVPWISQHAEEKTTIKNFYLKESHGSHRRKIVIKWSLNLV